ncbi:MULTISPECIES: hypothetical protein [unclassified Streptomyces]|uniref:hypothetical protein n=1 Tax=unclassified Streptomyces TaxID=2593676 RepID=UPI00158734AC|nr:MULTISPECIES: hypothetical protein [unclassified Streptomyces]NUV66530.1 hypothetical protein [Streptomyces sp. CAI-121]NUV98520.1 hypothetical protein [Streptomyces sp. CAI 127]NUW11788.1 hypothetical protein [Streptomyces sp. CAI-68]
MPVLPAEPVCPIIVTVRYGGRRGERVQHLLDDHGRHPDRPGGQDRHRPAFTASAAKACPSVCSPGTAGR